MGGGEWEGPCHESKFRQQIQLKSNQGQTAESNITVAECDAAVSPTCWSGLPGGAEGGGLPGQQNVIGLKLAEEAKETKAITEANSIRVTGRW